MDSIQITGIRCYGYTGNLPEEQVLGQWFEVDLMIKLDLSVSGQSDAIADTYNYVDAVANVQDLVKHYKVALLERLATAIADSILASKQVQQVTVRLTKLAAPIPDFGGKVTIELTRNS